MLDPKMIRQDIDTVIAKLNRRGYQLDTNNVESLENSRKGLQVELENLQSEHNKQAKIIGQKKAKGEAIDAYVSENLLLKKQLEEIQVKFANINQQLTDILMTIPNLPHESVPVGDDESHNLQLRTWGTPRQFDFTIRDHVDLGQGNDWLDFEAARLITGSRFVIMRQPCAQLHRALIQFMLDLHTQQHGYQEMYLPYIVNEKALYGTGQLPKFLDDQFALSSDQNMFLIPTAEVPLTNLVANTILHENDLPLKFVAHTPCFRREAGSYGKDTRGMIRQHQFEKVELVWVAKPNNSYEALEQLVSHAETVLQQLELPYRVISLCTGDLGFSAAKTYDLEIWLPSQDCYREISSCSNTESFQARRMHAKYKDQSNKKSWQKKSNIMSLINSKI